MSGNLLVTALAATLASAAPVADGVDALKLALDRGDYPAAMKLYSARLETFSPGSGNKRDWTLDRMAGELVARTAPPRDGGPFLEQARSGAATGADRADAALALGATQERAGDFVSATQSYRAAITMPPGTPTGRGARNALARILLAGGPDEAAGLLAEVIAAAPTAGERWEAELLLSRVAALAGRPDEARTRLAAAWADAPSASLEDAAVVRTAQDMAIDAAQAGNRDRSLPLNALALTGDSFAGADYLPQCGAAGVGADDYVIVELSLWHGGIRYSAVRASKPGIAKAFIDAIAPGAQYIFRPPLFVKLRCSDHSIPAIRLFKPEPLVGWMADKALYPVLSGGEDGMAANIFAIEKVLAQREARYGAKSPLLIPPLIALSGAYFALGAQDAGNYGRAHDAADRAAALAQAAGAPITVLRNIRNLAASAKLRAEPHPAEIEALYISQFAEAAAAPDVDAAVLAQTAISTAGAPSSSSDLRVRILGDALAALAARHISPGSGEVQLVARRMIDALHASGRNDRVRAVAAAAGIDPALCLAQDTPPKLSDTSIQSIGPDDYPKDALRTSLQGVIGIEIDIDAQGAAHDARLISTAPPGAFDEITLARARAFRAEPARTAGQAVSCKGFTQRVRWQIPSIWGDAAPWMNTGMSPLGE